MVEVVETDLIEARPTPRLVRRAPHVALVLVLLAAALVRFWRSPAEAGGRLVSPDGAEYAVAGHRLATLGTLDIDVGGTRYPIRYPPLFPALLAPVYAAAPGEIGNGIVVVLAFALLLVGAAYMAGHHLAGIWGAAAAAGAVIAHGLLAQLARTIMTDLPVAALTVTALALFLHVKRDTGAGVWCAAGLVAALAAGLRPLAGVLVLPFLGLILLNPRRAWVKLAGLLVPMLALGVATGLYNHDRFGSWRRSGYQFWCPIPYEFPSLTFAPRYFWDNVLLLAQPLLWLTLLAGAAGMVAIFSRTPRSAGRAAAFVGATGAALSLVHLFYFHAEARFHAPLIALCCVTGAAGAALLLPRWLQTKPWIGVVAATAALSFVRPPADRSGSSRPGMERLTAFVPPRGTIITRADPIPLDPIVLRPGARRWVPAWRHQNYAGHAIAPRPIALPASAVRWPGALRQPALFAAGARDAVAWTALERPDLIAQQIGLGPGVYLDASTVPPGSEPYKRIRQVFQLQPVDPEGLVLRLSLRPVEE